MRSASPRVTVLMPVFNGARYLDSAVQSILCQTHSDFELLVIDDGSTDDSPERIAAHRDPRIRVVRTGNRGVGAALRLGVELAAGAYVARMDADDIAAPNRLQVQAAALDSHPGVGIVDSGAYLIDRSGRPMDDEAAAPASDGLTRWRLLFRNVVTHPTVMLRRQVLLDSGESYRPGCLAEDYDLWMRLLPHTEFLRLPDKLLWYRRHSESVTAAWGPAHFQSLAGIIATGLNAFLGRPLSADVGADLAFLTRQTYQRPEDYDCRASSAELVDVMWLTYRAFLESYPALAPRANAISAEIAEQLLDWAWLLDRCRQGPRDGTRRLALAALRYRPAAIFSAPFARHLLSSAIGSRGLGHLRRALNR